MKRLDAGYWMFILGIGTFFGANIAGVYLAEMILPAALQPYAGVFVHIVEASAAGIFSIIFLLILMNSANRGITYSTPKECKDDLDQDVTATIFMVILATLIIGIPIGVIFVPTFFIPGYAVWESIDIHLKWSYAILTIFLISMCALRNWERIQTTKATLNAMYNIPTERIVPANQV